MLIMVFGGAMMLAMPYITVTHPLALFLPPFFDGTEVVCYLSWQKNLDPALLQEAQQNQAKLTTALQSGDLKSGYVSGLLVEYGNLMHGAQKF